MNDPTFSAEERKELLERIEALEAERNRRLHAEQSMAEARNRVDAELSRLHVFQNFMRAALRTEKTEELIENALETLIEAYEFESAALLRCTPDHELVIEGQFNLDRLSDTWSTPVPELDGNQARLHTDTELQPLNQALNLTEGLFCPISSESGHMAGLIVAGNTAAGVGTYTTPDDTLLSSFTMFGGQIAALHLNIRLSESNRQYTEQLQEERKLLEDRVEERTLELRQRELHMASYNRDLNTLTLVNEAVMKSVNEDQLLYEVCRLIVEANGKMMAWVGLVDFGPEKRIDVASHYGYHKGYLDGLSLTWNPSLRGLGPSGKAIRNGRYTLINDIVSDPDFEPWRTPALERGYGAVISVPMLHQGDAFGVVSVYAAEVNGFDEQNVKILERVADSVSYGIMALRADRARKAAETDLQESQANSSQLLSSVEDGIIATDIDGLIHYSNPATHRLLGLDADALIERPIFELLSEGEDHSEHPARHAINHASPLLRQAVQASRADGSRFPAEYSCLPLLESGKTTGAVFVLRDITRRHEAQAKLAQQLDFRQAMLDTIPYPLFYKGPDTRFLGFNRAYEEAFDVKREDLIGKRVVDLEYLPEADRITYQAEDVKVIAEAGSASHEMNIQFADGREHRTLYSVEGFRLADGSPGGLVGTFVDITDLDNDQTTAQDSDSDDIPDSLKAQDEHLSREDLVAAFPNPGSQSKRQVSETDRRGKPQ